MSNKFAKRRVDREYYRGPDAPEEPEVHTGFDTVAQAIARRKEDQAERAATPTQAPEHATKAEDASLEWEIGLTATALASYERRMKSGEDLIPEEMRVFLSLLNAMRQLKLAYQALQKNDGEADMGPVEIALGLIETGMTKKEVLALYPDNPKVREALK